MALDTLFFDLKINDMTDEQMKTIKSRLEKQLGLNLDLGKQIEQSVNKGGGVKVKVGADTTVVEASLRRIKEIMNQPSKTAADRNEMLALSKVIKNVSDDKTKLARADEIAMRAADAHALAQERLAKAALQTEKAQQSLATAHTRATQSANSHINANVRLGQSLTGLISITGDLRNQIGMLVSVYTVEHLLKNVVVIGGEFEKQKLAMGSMLGSLEQADDIFNRMKNLALTSPFNFKDLSNYSRQLTAFGTPYKDLYDTTNRLADISAGLGGDMSRLVLAFSQVKAAAYLRGQEMRQFTEFGVSLPDLLAKKYSEAEHRIVTAGDVIERVSKRMVSFKDVKDVLWKSTDKGGQFYGMQDVLAQSTSGMASNLKDAIDTMYYDIANSNSGMIKESIKGITELVSHWRDFTSAMTAGLGIYSAYRLVMSAHNRLLGINTAATYKGVIASKAEEASILRKKALYTQLTPQEQMLIATQNELTFSDLKQLASSKAINADALIRMANAKKITASQALQVASTLELSAGQRKYLIDLQRVEIELSKASGMMSKFALSAERMSMVTANRMMSIGSNISSFFSGIFTKGNILMAAAFIGLDAFLSYQQRAKQLDDTNLQTIKNAEDGYKNLSEFLAQNPIDAALKKGDGNEIDKLIESYKEQLQSTPLDMSGFITNVDSITDASERLKELRAEIEALKAADDTIAKNGNPFVQAQKNQETGMFGGVFSTIDRGLAQADRAVINFLGKINLIPESFRNWADSGDEAMQTLDTAISDVNDRLYTLQTQMYKMTNKDIQDAIDKMKKDYPEMAKGIEQMRDAGASNNEVLLAMAKIEYDKGGSFLNGKLDPTDINKYFTSYYSATSKMSKQIDEVVARTNSSLNKVDVEGHSEKWKLAILKAGQEQAKALGLQGDMLEQWTFMLESAVNKNSLRLKDHPQAWKSMYEQVNSILAKNGKTIQNASQEQVQKAIQAAANELAKAKPWLANWIAAMNRFTANHPIYVYTEVKKIDNQSRPVASGRGKELTRNRDILHTVGYSTLANVKTDEDAYKLVEDKYKQYKDDLKNARGNRESTKKITDTWNKWKDAMNEEMDVAFIINGGKDKAPKKGSKEDTFLKDMRARLDSVKKAMDEYKKWIQAGKSESESIGDVESMGIFSKGTFAKMSTESELNAWYKRTIKNLEDMMRKNKPSTERKKFLNEILSNLTDFDGDEFKRKLDEYSKQVETLISDTKTKWDNYQKLLSAGSSREDAANFSFGGKSKYSSLSEAMVGNFYDQMAKKNIRKNIDFGMKEEDVKKLLGDGKIAEELLKLWKEAKSQIEKDRIDIQINADKAKEQISSISDKIKSSIEKALDQSLGINISSGKQTRLSEVSSIDKNTGLLKLDENAKDILSPSQIENAKNLIESENQEITKLSSSLLELLPAWDDILGKAAYKSLSDLLRGMREAKEIISNAKVVNDKNGKPSYFTSSYKDRDGKEQSVSGNIGELDRLKNQTDTRQGDINKKDPFVGMYQSANSYFGAKQQEKKWSDLSKQAEKNGGTTTYTDDKGKKQTITKKDADSKSNDASGEASKASLSFAEALQNSVGKLQTWNNRLSMLGSTIEALGGGSDVSDAAGVAGGMLGGAMSMSSLGPWGMAAGAAMGLISGIASMHDKKLDESIEKSKQKVKELQLAYKQIEDNLKYYLGNAAENTLVSTSDVERVQKIQASIKEIRSKGELNLFDKISLAALTEELKNYSATVKYLDSSDSVNYKNAYNYQRNLYKDQLEQLKQQKSDEEDKKKTDQSKINDYNSQIQDMETKIQQFSLDLANSLYGIDIKGWASQLGDALFEAWQKGEDGAEAFRNKANEIIASVANKWLTQKIIEPAMEKMMTDMVDKDGQGGWLGENNNMTQSDIVNNLSKDLYDVESSVDTYNKAVEALDEAYKKKYGKSLKDAANGSSSTANSISGVTEQEANIIAAYMDAIRQDTYNNRMNIQKIVESGLKITENPMMQAQLLELQKIESNTYKNMELVGEIKSLFNDITLGNKKVYVK